MAGKRKKKNHTGNLENIKGWDKEALKEEVDGYAEGTIVNWSELARRYGVTDKTGNTAKNGGQIIQDVLISMGVNVHQFKNPKSINSCNERKKRARKRKLRGRGGEITVPTPDTNNTLKNKLKLQIRNGDISIGEMIVPKRFKKLVLNKDNKIVTTEFVVEGRKRPLDEIRKNTLKKQKEFLRQHPDNHYDEMPRLDVVERLTLLNEFDDADGLTKMRKKLKSLERTRHLAIWHDHSTVANHGHLLFMVSALYDPACYLTSAEYKAKTGQDINIQEEIERPQVYIIARYDIKKQAGKS